MNKPSENNAINGTPRTLGRLQRPPPNPNPPVFTKFERTAASPAELERSWMQRIGAARVAWGELTQDELLRSGGYEHKLTDLVQERYALSREEAGLEVRRFVERHRAVI